MFARDEDTVDPKLPFSPPLTHEPTLSTTIGVIETESKVGSVPQETSKVRGDGAASTAVSHLTHAVTQALATEIPLATSVSAATISSPEKSHGVSTGAVTGIAIGTAILGAVIAFCLAFFLFKRRQRPSPSQISDYDPNPELVALSKGPSSYVQEVSLVSAPLGAAAVAAKHDMDLTDLSHSSDFLASVLPQTANAQAVTNKVSMLFDQIQQHVENFYRDVHASITPSMESDLARFGTPHVDIMELLQGSSMPTVTIKHALMGYVLTTTSPDGDEATLFPGDITGVGGKKQFAGTPDLSAAYIIYKRLAVHLHAAVQYNAQARLSDVREAAEHFALTFFPWANPTYGDQEKDEDLVQLISSALDLSIWLHGQPFIYEFIWEGVGRRGIVVSPGLTKISYSKGMVHEQQQVLLEPVIVST